MQSTMVQQHRHESQASGPSLFNPRSRCYGSHVREPQSCLRLIFDLTFLPRKFAGELCATLPRDTASSQRSSLSTCPPTNDHFLVLIMLLYCGSCTTFNPHPSRFLPKNCLIWSLDAV